ncbi:MAG: STAS domain-containing protein [Clostridia bacterium]|nr:STAS domain-containing protein [Clostridia bacterium]
MQCRIESSGNIITAYLDGEIDHHTAKDVREKIDAQIMAQSPELLVLDFRDVTFMDSSGIGLVMGRYKQMQLLSGQLHISNLSPHIKKVMQLAGMDRLATIKN